MSKIYITGDIHGDPFRFSSKNFSEGKDLTKDDYVIIAGDFGLIWRNNPTSEERYRLQWLEDKPWTTLFVDGNHENHALLAKLPVEDRLSGKVGVVLPSIYHLKRGEIYLIGGKKFFCFGGAYSWDRWHRTLGVSYWDEEVPNHKETDYGLQQLKSHQYEIDYIVTHTMPMSLIETLGFSKDAPDGNVDPTGKYFDYIANSATFKKWYFGHMHVDSDMGKFKCLYRNIDCIM